MQQLKAYPGPWWRLLTGAVLDGEWWVAGQCLRHPVFAASVAWCCENNLSTWARHVVNGTFRR